ncbi:M81 family metallopeptidase [Mesorhizobium sp. M0960]|uniref:M81 family metallopeptidase n=1 Tax=Mesorhizobium sp. M0960 TaxID=2957035 RepID=UPI00333A306B
MVVPLIESVWQDRIRASATFSLGQLTLPVTGHSEPSQIHARTPTGSALSALRSTFYGENSKQILAQNMRKTFFQSARWASIRWDAGKGANFYDLRKGKSFSSLPGVLVFAKQLRGETMAKRRILTGGIAQESHSFNPILTPRERFTIIEGQDAIERNRGANSTFGGIVDSAYAAAVDLVVPTVFRAQSGGVVDDRVFVEVSDIMIDAARRGDFDAIVLPLHGGMLTQTLADPEGVLIAQLRAVVGNDIPITAAFDLHAHVKETTLEPLDFLAGYLTNPHEDQSATAKRAFRAAMGMLEGTFEPVVAATFLPMLTLGNDTTLSGPLDEIHAYAKEAVKQGRAWDVSIFNSQQFLDVPAIGQAVLVYGNDEFDEARKLANEIMRMIWDFRDDFIITYPTVEQELQNLASFAGPIVIGDQGDRVIAGAPGDSTYILNYLLQHKIDVVTYFPVYDPEAVAVCAQAGIGSEINLTFGGKYSTVSPSVRAYGKIVGVGDNVPVVYDGPSDEGTKTYLEKYAVFRMGNINVVLTNQPYGYIDPAYFRAVGLDPSMAKLIVTRSGYHFKLNFAKIGRVATVDTPGMSSYYLDQFQWQHARPFYPLDAIEYEPRQYSRRRARGAASVVVQGNVRA